MATGMAVKGTMNKDSMDRPGLSTSKPKRLGKELPLKAFQDDPIDFYL